METSTLLGMATLGIAAISYTLYIRDVLRGETKPNSITWLVWALLNGFIFSQQVIHGGGAGSWALGVTALANIGIFLLALRFGESSSSKTDWLCLALAIATLALWAFTDDPVVPVVLASLTFIIGFVPTFRKSYRQANQETLATYALNASKFTLVLFALQSFTLVTALYPAVLVVLNASFVAFLLTRRMTGKRKRVRVRT